MKNLGKIFEQNWKLSIPQSDKIFYYRLKDSASSYYGGNENLRFSQNNMSDAFMFFAGEYTSVLLILEFKNHKGKSLPLSCIRRNQLEEMSEAGKKVGVIPMIVVFFSDVERCFSLSIEFVENFIEKNERKSIPIEYFEELGIEIDVKKLKTNYRYDIGKWLNNF